MSVTEVQSAFRQTLDRRRLRLRMSAQRLHPIVQVVNANHQDIGGAAGRFLRGHTMRCQHRRTQNNDRQNEILVRASHVQMLSVVRLNDRNKNRSGWASPFSSEPKKIDACLPMPLFRIYFRATGKSRPRLRCFGRCLGAFQCSSFISGKTLASHQPRLDRQYA